ncbi:MAG: hypothetical protein K1X89_02150 [Myxococcaceae bacterium]|nr:hypothetical protein [Myxococcaceae bacterium]
MLASVMAAAALAVGSMGCGQVDKSEWPTENEAMNAPVYSSEVAPPKSSSDQCYYYWHIYYKYTYKERAGYWSSCGFEVCEYIGIPVSNLTGCNNYSAGEGGICAGGLPFC